MFLIIINQVVQLNLSFSLGIDFGSFRIIAIFVVFSAARIEIAAMLKALKDDITSVLIYWYLVDLLISYQIYRFWIDLKQLK